MAYKQKKIDFTSPKVLAWVLPLGLLLLLFAKTIINKISSGLAFLGAKKDTPVVINETINNPGIRYTYVQGVVDTVHAEINNGFFSDTDEKLIVREMNKLQSAEEVIFASTYYRNKHGKSLKEVLKAELNSAWRDGSGFLGKVLNPNASGGSYTNLTAVVQQNLL